VRLVDYRDVAGRYDRIASIEMIEAVGEAYWPAFFQMLRERLVPGGTAAIQAITIADRLFARYRNGVEFIQRYVFPGGMLPSPGSLRSLTDASGLAWVEDARYGADYAQTLSLWRARFDQAWPRIAELGFDDRFRRMWCYYLSYCEAGFRCGRIDVSQIVLRRPALG
jgi:cyclopropane-fatty-acyl-phospholipid synthase